LIEQYYYSDTSILNIAKKQQAIERDNKNLLNENIFIKHPELQFERALNLLESLPE
jgi:hypothetical protein